MTVDNKTGDFRLSPFDLCGVSDYPYGHHKMRWLIPVEIEISNCIGVVRAALKKAKANL